VCHWGAIGLTVHGREKKKKGEREGKEDGFRGHALNRSLGDTLGVNGEDLGKWKKKKGGA